MEDSDTVTEPTPNKGVMHQVTETKALIEKHYYRIDVIEKVLAKRDMEEKDREQLESELDALKKILVESEASINSLHDANKETTKLAAMFMFLILGIYCIYSVFVNDN